MDERKKVLEQTTLHLAQEKECLDRAMEAKAVEEEKQTEILIEMEATEK